MESQLNLLEQLLDEGRGFGEGNYCYPNRAGREFGGDDRPEWSTWKTRSRNLILQLTSPESPGVNLANKAVRVDTSGNYHTEFQRARDLMLKALELTIGVVKEDSFGELQGPRGQAPSPALSNKVFIVHGHDNSLKTDVERLMREFGLEPIVLHRQPDQGRTIIEKFEQNSDVGYAFILLTPDEIAFPVSQENSPDNERQLEKRARPNVIFEFGFFAAKLGRDRVCCLYKQGVVLPSDLSGLIYKEIGETIDAQSYAIAQELKAAGYSISL